MHRKLCALALTFIIALLPLPAHTFAEEIAEEITPAPALPGVPPEIAAPSAVLMDAETGIVLFDKNMNEKNYPASTTKVMNALLTLENYEDQLDTRVPFSYDAVFSNPWDGSSIAMNDGESLSVEQALYGMLLPSANEVANALGELNSGTMAQFAEDMTARAAELGATNTHFVNPNGLFDPEHYTTAHDMALIMREAVKHPLFTKIISTPRYDIPPTEKQPEVRVMHNSNKMIQPDSAYYNSYVIGGKTGFTDEAQHTLATYAEKDGIKLVVFIMHGEGTTPYTDTAALLDYGFTQYTDQQILEGGAISTEASVSLGANAPDQTTWVMLTPEKSMTLPLPKNAKDFITYKMDVNENIVAPVYKEQVLGKITAFVNDVELGSANLLAMSNVWAAVLPTPAPTAQTVPVAQDDLGSTVVPIAAVVAVVSAAALIAILVLRLRLNRRDAYRAFKGYKYKGK